MVLVETTTNQIRLEARESPRAHIIKVNGFGRDGYPASFAALALDRPDSNEEITQYGYVEGGLNIPAGALQQLNEFLLGYIWGPADQSQPLYIVPRGVLAYDKLTGHCTDRWAIDLPPKVDDAPPGSFYIAQHKFFPGYHRPEYDPERYG